MAATTTAYAAAGLHLALARVDLLTADLRLLLAGSGYSPDYDADTWAADITGEVVGGTYPPGGIALTGRGVALVDGAAVLTCDPAGVDDPAFLYRYAVLYADTGDPAASPLLACTDHGTDIDPSGTALTLTYTGGVLTIERAPL